MDKDKKVVLKNTLYLTLLQGAGYVFPLITLPYLIRILDVDDFGLLAFATATVSYFLLITDYGFNLSATKEISLNRNDKIKIEEIFSSVLTVKLLLLVICFLILSLLTAFIPKYSENSLIYFFTFGTVLAQVLFPVWLFQGLEEMKYVTNLNVLSRALSTICIFIFVNKPEDFHYVPIITSIGVTLSSVISLYIAHSKFGISYKLQGYKTIEEQFVTGWNIFLSRIYTNIYVNGNVLLLGFMTNNTIVGYYSIADRIVQTLSALFSPIYQASFPYLSRLFTQKKSEFFIFLRKINIGVGLLSVASSLGFYFLSKQIIFLFSGDMNPEVVNILKILSISLVFFQVGPLYTYVLIAAGKSEIVTHILKVTVIVNFLLAIPLIHLFGAYGLAWSWVLMLAFHSVYFLLNYNRHVIK
ncbi:flippase [Parashewanella curva]|uniref:Flippase n=1 Tax=Parashewanella curva TaxID=2338552 RepID=A0A3L8Q336_9GAMM|nr:flippase [Parashewanella curva]RLV61413.1 flippase [Parashewanella curva]